MEAGKIDIAYENVSKVTVNFYVMDIELLFSTNPFIKARIEFMADFLQVPFILLT